MGDAFWDILGIPTQIHPIQLGETGLTLATLGTTNPGRPCPGHPCHGGVETRTPPAHRASGKELLNILTAPTLFSKPRLLLKRGFYLIGPRHRRVWPRQAPRHHSSGKKKKGKNWEKHGKEGKGRVEGRDPEPRFERGAVKRDLSVRSLAAPAR